MKPFHQWLGDLAEELSDGKVNEIGLTSEDLQTVSQPELFDPAAVYVAPTIGTPATGHAVYKCPIRTAGVPVPCCTSCGSGNLRTTSIAMKDSWDVYSYICKNCNVMFNHVKMRDGITGEEE